MRLVEGVLARTVRVEDTIGRTGSNEFMLLLPATTEAGARALRLRLREVFESQQFEIRGRQVEIDPELSTHLPKTYLDAVGLMKQPSEDPAAGRVLRLAHATPA
jgi:GGDEF domain-containing protein